MNGLFLIILLFVASTVKCQIDYNKIILPDELSEVIDIRERLVQLAWKNHPDSEIANTNKDIAEYNLNKSHLSWSQDIRAQFNFNEGNINPPDGLPNLFFPRYNFSVNVPLSTFFLTSKDVKIARSNYKKASLQINKEKLRIRKEVLIKYQNFLMTQEIYQIESEITEDEYSKYLIAEQSFKEGSISLEEYSTILKSYNTQRKNKLNSENNYLSSKLELEEMIGMQMEDVL